MPAVTTQAIPKHHRSRLCAFLPIAWVYYDEAAALRSQNATARVSATRHAAAKCDRINEKRFMADGGKLILVDRIEPLIRTLRGQNVMLDSDLAALYGVP